MLTKRQLEDAAGCKTHACTSSEYECGMHKIRHYGSTCTWQVAQTALAYRAMLADVADTLDTITDIIDESGEWGNINALATLETLNKAKTLLKESEG